MIVTLDTNVLVSGLLFGGPPRQIVALVASGRITNIISVDILAEVSAVLRRPKFGLAPAQVTAIVRTFQDTFLLVSPTTEVRTIKDDPDDNRILEAALAGNAQAIVSGDRHLLSLQTWKGIPIHSPAAFLEHLEASGEQ